MEYRFSPRIQMHLRHLSWYCVVNVVESRLLCSFGCDSVKSPCSQYNQVVANSLYKYLDILTGILLTRLLKCWFHHKILSKIFLFIKTFHTTSVH